MKITPIVAFSVLASFLPGAAAAQDGSKSISEISTGIAREISAKDAAERNAAPKTLDEVVAAARQDHNGALDWSEDEGNAGFDAETRARIRILSAIGPLDGMRHFKAVFDPKLGVRDNSFEFAVMSRDVRLLRLRGVKRCVAVDYGTGSQYYELAEFAHYLQHVWDPGVSYSQAGSYFRGEAQDVADIDVMADILTRFMKVKAGDPMIATLRERVKNNAQDHPFIINGDAKLLLLGVGETGMEIWPDEKKAR